MSLVLGRTTYAAEGVLSKLADPRALLIQAPHMGSSLNWGPFSGQKGAQKGP